MIIAILLATTLICAAGWMKNRIILLTMVTHMQKKGCPDPTDEEVKECTTFVIKNLLRDLNKSKL